MINLIIIYLTIFIIIIIYLIKYRRIINTTNFPQHIAMIMDGNGRWAKKKGQVRTFGHENGSNNMRDIIYECFYNGSKYLTFYVFAEQNWKRPIEEVEKIFDIVYEKIKFLVDKTNLIRILVQGRLDRIPIKLRKLLEKIVTKTKDRKYTIILCIDYSGKTEILNACSKLIENNLIVNKENLEKNLYVQDIPEPDLIIRTGGEKRLSDFLTWQSCYSEFYFTKIFWPDFNSYQLKKAVYDYNNRHRRFGDIK